MAWETIPGTGDLILGAADNFGANTLSGTNLGVTTASITNLVATTQTVTNLTVHDSAAIVNREQAAALGGWVRLYRSGAEKARIGLDGSDMFTVLRGATDVMHTTFETDGEIVINEVETAPASGDITTSQGALYIQSGALHYMGALGQVTVVASAG